MTFLNAHIARAAALGAVLFGAGCAGGSHTALPVSAPAPATGQSIVSVTIQVPGTAATSRDRKYISPNAKSVAILVTPGNAAFAPASGCVNIVAGTTSYTVAIPAPNGSDTFRIQAFDGVCATTASGSAGTGNVLDTTADIVGTVTAGAANTLNSMGVAPAQPCPGTCTIVVSQAINLAASGTTFTASLSAATPNLTRFESDPGVTMALPVTFVLHDAGGNVLTSPDANGQTIPLLQPVTLTLTDTSSNATGATLGLAMVDGTGKIYCPTAPASGTFLVTFAAVATATCSGNQTTSPAVFAGTPTPRIAVVLTAAPRATDRFVIVYNGATPSTFQSATFVATSGSILLGTINISNQSVVNTQLGGPSGETGIASSALGSVEFVTAASKVYAQVAGAPVGAGSGAATGATLTGIAFMNAATPAVYTVDPSCAGCDGTHVAIYALGGTPATVNGQTPVQLTTTGALTTTGLLQPVLPPFQRGIVGIATLSPGQGGASTFGSLLVAANNSIYRLDLASATTVSAISLVAGAGVAGPLGEGSVDGPSGLQATFNLGLVTFAGMGVDGTGKLLFLADPGNNAVRRISLSTGNATDTWARLPGTPVGLAVDTASGFVYAAIPSQNVVVQAATAGGAPTLFAGQTNVQGSQDGLASSPYPIQFNAGNPVSNAGSVLPAYAGLWNAAVTNAIGPNSNATAQQTIGPNSYIATLNVPTGLCYDPAAARLYLVDQGSTLLRTVL